MHRNGDITDLVGQQCKHDAFRNVVAFTNDVTTSIQWPTKGCGPLRGV